MIPDGMSVAPRVVQCNKNVRAGPGSPPRIPPGPPRCRSPVRREAGREGCRESAAPEVAGFILVSTLLTIVVLPLALAFWV